MASRTVGSIQIDLDAMIARFDANMDRANKRLDRIERNAKKAADSNKKAAERADKAWKAAGRTIGLVTAGLVALASAAASARVVKALDAAADKVVDLGKKSAALGVPIEHLSELRFAAEQNRIPLEQLTDLLTEANIKFGEFARSGKGPAAEALTWLNLQLFDTRGRLRDVVDLLPDIARRFRTLDRSAQFDLADKLFGGESGERFVQLLNTGFFDRLEEARERAGRLGVVFSQDQVDRLTRYTEAVHNLGEAWFGIKVRVIDALAPEIEEFLNNLAGLMAATPDIIEAIAEAFRSDDPAIDRQLAELGTVLNDILSEAGWTAGSLFVAGLRDALVIGATALKPIAIDLGSVLVSGIGERFSAGWGMLADLLERTGRGHPDTIEFLRQLEATTGGGAEELSDQRADRFFQAFEQGRRWRFDMATPRAVASAAENLGSLFADATAKADGLFGIMQKIRAHSMDIDLRNALFGGGAGRGGPGKPDPTEWQQFLSGISAGYDELLKRATDFESLGQASITTFTEAISGDLASALASGEANLENFGDTVTEVFTKAAESVLALVLRFYLAQSVLAGLSALGFGGAGSSGGSLASYSPTSGISVPQRHGGAWFDGLPISRYASGGVVTRPTLFPMRRGAGLMGEAGPEAILPLTRVGGDLGVKAVGGVVVQVIDQRGSGQPVEVEESRGPDGRRVLRILIRDEVRKLLGDGALDRTLGSTFGLRRRGTPR